MAFKLGVLAWLFPILSWGAGPGLEQSGLDWRTEIVSLSNEVKIQIDGETGVETLLLPDGQKVDLDTKATASSDAAAFDQLSAKEKEDLHESRRSMMVAIARMVWAKKFSSVAIVQDERAAYLAPTAESIEKSGLEVSTPLENALGVGEKRDGRLKNFLKMLNEAILLSTFRAGKDHWENRKEMKGLANEFGVQITLKGEFQFGLGSINITRNLPIVLGLGYRRDTREVMIRVGRRQESMSGGTAFSAGVKVELRKYQRVHPTVEGIQIEGASWYPPSLPMVSLVGDAGAHYRSVGVVFGVNAADLVPGLYFVNTVNGFKDRDLYTKSIAIDKMPAWVQKAADLLTRSRGGARPMAPVLCSGLYL